MAALMHKPWIKEAALNGTIPKVAYAQIIEYLKHPATNASTASLYLSDKWHYIETVFTEECIKEFESKGITSLGSIRGGLISVKEGIFYPSTSFANFVFVVNRAVRVGIDGSFTVGDPVWVNNDPSIKDFLKSLGKERNQKQPVNVFSSSTLFAISELTLRKMAKNNTNNKGLIWEDCIIPHDQQLKLDSIWPDSFQDTGTKFGFFEMDINTSKSVAFDQSDIQETNIQVPEFYEYFTNVDLEFDIMTNQSNTEHHATPSHTLYPRQYSTSLSQHSSSMYLSQSPSMPISVSPQQPLSQALPHSNHDPHSNHPHSNQDLHSNQDPHNNQDPHSNQVSPSNQDPHGKVLQQKVHKAMYRPLFNTFTNNSTTMESPLGWIPVSMRVQIKDVKRKMC